MALGRHFEVTISLNMHAVNLENEHNGDTGGGGRLEAPLFGIVRYCNID
jgi:hypothetical protein